MSALVPTDAGGAFKLAEMMATGKLVPVHLQRSPGDCLMVIEQAATDALEVQGGDAVVAHAVRGIRRHGQDLQPGLALFLHIGLECFGL